MVMRALHWIGIAHPPMTVAEFCEAVSLNDDMDAIGSEDIIEDCVILRCCSSLVRKSHDGLRYEFAHFTVPQYLSSIDPHSSVGRYRLSKAPASVSLATLSLQYLSLEQFNQEPVASEKELLKSAKRHHHHPFYRYASRNWFRGVDDYLSDQGLISMYQLFFSHNRRGCYLSWIIELLFSIAGNSMTLNDEDQLELIKVVLESGISALHLAASIGRHDICKLLFERGEEINRRR